MGIRRMLQRRKLRKTFQDYVSPEVIEKLLRNAKSEVKPSEVKHFQFVVILADDSNPQQVPAMIGKVMDLLRKHHANVSNITSSLFVGVLGVPFPEGNSPEARRELVDELLQEFGAQIRIAHGECDGLFGSLGGPTRWTCGAIIPAFSRILRQLLEANPGAALEIS